MVMGTGRVVVGVDGSPASLRALWFAVEEARCRLAQLTVVNSPAILGGAKPAAAGLGPMSGAVAPTAGLSAAEEEQGRLVIEDAFIELYGGHPGDILVRVVVSLLAPGPALVNAVGPGDLLVVGKSRGGIARRLISSSISKYCVAFAPCPVLIVPGPEAPKRSYSKRQLRRGVQNGGQQAA